MNEGAKPGWHDQAVQVQLRDRTHGLGFAPARASTAVVASLMALCCGAPAGAQTLDQLYALAKQEKTLVLWAAGPSADHETAVRAFEEQFPGVTVSLTGGFSNVLNTGIEEQLRTKKVETDLAMLQTVQDFVAWEKRGLLQRFKPVGFDKINNLTKDKEGAWIAVTRNPIFYGYNTEQVRRSEVPQLATDFLRARFKGKLVSAYPADDDVTLFAFGTVVEKYGWSYMTQYMKQQPKFIQGHLGVARAVGSGESFATFDATVLSALSVQRAGGKIALTGPTDDYLPLFFTAEAILKDAPHPNAAKLYVTWFLSKEWQSRMGTYPSRDDVPSPPGLPPLSNRVDERYLEFVTNEAQLADLRRRFESYTGPVINAGGVR
jgi:ABC-type Fe3+ transport system substrate-binding protein